MEHAGDGNADGVRGCGGEILQADTQQGLDLPLFLWRSRGHDFHQLCIDLEGKGGGGGLQGAKSWPLTFQPSYLDVGAQIDGTGQDLMQQHNHLPSAFRGYVEPHGMEGLGCGRDGSYRFLAAFHGVSTACSRWLWSRSGVIGLRYVRDACPLGHRQYTAGDPCGL